VEFIDHVILEREAEPGVILPMELRINYLRRSVDAFGLKSGSGIRMFLPTIEAVEVSGTGLYALRDTNVVTEFILQ
jgi:hypothetical protein